MNLPADRLSAIRQAMLQPFGLQFDAPTRVALYLFGEDIAVIENFNDESAKIALKTKSRNKPEIVFAIPKSEESPLTVSDAGSLEIPARSLVTLSLK